MPITTCSECGDKISTHADACPHCGSPAAYALKSWREENTPSILQSPAGHQEPPQLYSAQIEQGQPTRPHKVGTAVTLLFISLLIGIPRVILEATRPTLPPASFFIGAIFTFLIMLFFIFMIGRGRNWARIIFLVFFILGMPFAVPLLMQSLAANPISGLLGIAQMAIQIVALIFLFEAPSSDWFRGLPVVDGGVKGAQPQKPAAKFSTIGIIAIVAMVCLSGYLLKEVAVPKLKQACENAARTTCFSNQITIRTSIQQWATDKRKGDSDSSWEDDIKGYFKDEKFPQCPAGGNYDLGTVDSYPSCSVNGCYIDEEDEWNEDE